MKLSDYRKYYAYNAKCVVPSLMRAGLTEGA